MGHQTNKYLPLSVEEKDEPIQTAVSRSAKASSWLHVLLTICAIQCLVIVGCLVVISRERARSCEPRLLYSPAYEIVEPELKVFTIGTSRRGFTKYQGYGPEVDAAWQDLYNGTILRIPKNQADLLPNRTAQIANDPDGYYMAQLEVFHQLHCLNMVRMALYMDHYKDKSWELDDDHVKHCLDNARQALMCGADLSVNVWRWHHGLNLLSGHSTQIHQCRNFDKLRDWSREHQMLAETPYDPTIKVPDE